MQSKALTVDEYINQLPEHQKEAITLLRKVIVNNIPEGFSEQISYGMIGFVVPHKLYPNGYHCNPKLPLPFLNIAAQKNFIAIYHMGIYADPALLAWFTKELAKVSKKKPDIGKSCLRFKNQDTIPYELVGQLAQKQTVADWINLYESKFIQKK